MTLKLYTRDVYFDDGRYILGKAEGSFSETKVFGIFSDKGTWVRFEPSSVQRVEEGALMVAFPEPTQPPAGIWANMTAGRIIEITRMAERAFNASRSMSWHSDMRLGWKIFNVDEYRNINPPFYNAFGYELLDAGDFWLIRPKVYNRQQVEIIVQCVSLHTKRVTERVILKWIDGLGIHVAKSFSDCPILGGNVCLPVLFYEDDIQLEGVRNFIVKQGYLPKAEKYPEFWNMLKAFDRLWDATEYIGLRGQK